MSDYRKRSTKRKKRKEATLVGDLFKILFAVAMLIIAILVAFFVFKNVSGFTLPDLRVTAAETQESETATVVSIDTKESAAVETSAQIQVTENAQQPAETATAHIVNYYVATVASRIVAANPSVKSSEAESKKESTAEDESRETKESKSTDKVEELPSRKDTDIEGPVPGGDRQGEVSNGPVVGTDTVKESPETVQKDGAVISEGGPVGG